MLYLDCYSKFDGCLLTLENARIRTVFSVCNGQLYLDELTDLARNITAKCPLQHEPEPLSAPEMQITDQDGLSNPMLCVRLCFQRSGFSFETLLQIFPELPFVGIRFFADGRLEDPQGDIITLPILSPHTRLTSVMLNDRTDLQDYLADYSVRPLYGKAFGKEDTDHIRGGLFYAEDLPSGSVLFAARNAPTRSSGIGYAGYDCVFRGSRGLTLTGIGADGTGDGMTELYGCTVGFGGKDIPALYKKYYRSVYRGEDTLFVMSNTWGDRSQDKAVCESFMLKEIDRAASIGVDIVQIDDGWQKGATKNSAVTPGGVWAGYYANDSNFWSVHPGRFPNGLEPIASYARNNGVRLALWFSPDSSNEFSNWERDVETLLNLHTKYGIVAFKLDGINIKTKLGESRLLMLMRSIWQKTKGSVRFNLDITAQKRLGYLYQKAFGTLFVENRYTDTGNYYPHNTLKNLWCLSRWLPSEKFQFELLNPDRNHAVYGNDLLAPKYYTIDYEFACVMMANPLVWMEMSALSDTNATCLATAIKKWKQIRDDLRHADLSPIGEMPDGYAFTGFRADLHNHGYLLLFRESSEEDTYVWHTELPQNAKLNLLMTNALISLPEIKVSRSDFTTHFPRPRTYVLYRWIVE